MAYVHVFGFIRFRAPWPIVWAQPDFAPYAAPANKSWGAFFAPFLFEAGKFSRQGVENTPCRDIARDIAITRAILIRPGPPTTRQTPIDVYPNSVVDAYAIVG